MAYRVNWSGAVGAQGRFSDGGRTARSRINGRFWGVMPTRLLQVPSLGAVKQEGGIICAGVALKTSKASPDIQTSRRQGGFTAVPALGEHKPQ